MTRSDDHPAPERHRVGAIALGAILTLAPSAWALHLLVKQGLASGACRFARSLHAAATPPAIARPVLLGIDGASLLLALLGLVLAMHAWRRTHGEEQGGGEATIEIGEGRTRFLALCGALLAGGAVLAILFDTLASWLVPSCA